MCACGPAVGKSWRASAQCGGLIFNDQRISCGRPTKHNHATTSSLSQHKHEQPQPTVTCNGNAVQVILLANAQAGPSRKWRSNKILSFQTPHRKHHTHLFLNPALQRKWVVGTNGRSQGQILCLPSVFLHMEGITDEWVCWTDFYWYWQHI